MMEKSIKIDSEKLLSCMNEAGKGKQALSKELGRSESYMYQVLKKGMVNENIERLICLILEKPPGYFKLKEQETVLTRAENNSDAKIFQNIYKEILTLRSEIASMQKSQEEALNAIDGFNAYAEKVLSKANANTIQLEKNKRVGKALNHVGFRKSVMLFKGTAFRREDAQ